MCGYEVSGRQRLSYEAAQSANKHSSVRGIDRFTLATYVNCSAIPMKGHCGSVRSVCSGLIRSGMTDYKQCICARSCPSVSTYVA